MYLMNVRCDLSSLGPKEVHPDVIRTIYIFDEEGTNWTDLYLKVEQRFLNIFDDMKTKASEVPFAFSFLSLLSLSLSLSLYLYYIYI